MKKTLLLYSRICPTDSQHTIKIFNELSKLEGITAFKLDGSKPFDIPYEQEFIKKFDNVILLFTINWFNLPWNLSRYMAEVWRTGVFNLEGINFYTIVTTGSKTEIYSKESDFGWTAEEYLNNLSSVFKRLKANYINKYFYYDCVNYDENRLNNFIDSLKDEYNNKIKK